MKIYFPNYNINNILKVDLKQYQNNKKKELHIYSAHGLYIIDNNELYYLTIIDEKTISIPNFIHKNDIIIDKSEIIKTQTSQIPPNHIIMEVITITYKINNQLNLCIINNKENDIIDFYFEVPKNINFQNNQLKNDLEKVLLERISNK
jgi:uncharacterized protein (DUF2344 family)